MRLTALLISCAMPAMAQDILLEMPIDCTLGESCYIQNYVDHDPSEGASDFACGSLTYDTHKGTDFGLPSLSAMDAGVDVLASASGIVRGVRNDMRDVIYSDDLAGEINGRDCGNGVVIAHDDLAEQGWETQYCHMREGSVTVQTGERVEAGDVLGQVGLSGRTQFPHVHMSLRRNGQTIDPFDPDGVITCGDPSDETLWADPLDTPAGGLLSLGFATNVPDYQDVKAGTAAATSLQPDAPIVLWAFAFGAQEGDVLSIEFNGPKGPLFQTEDVLSRTQALFMRAGGLNPPDQDWDSGTYTGLVVHSRGGVELDRMTTAITLP